VGACLQAIGFDFDHTLIDDKEAYFQENSLPEN
jgi:hypothetical protein